MPADVFGTPDDKTLLVGLTGSDAVEVFDVSGPAPRSVRRIQTGAGAHAFRAAGDKRHVYLSNRVANTISKIDLATLNVVDTYPATTSRWARKLTIIDTEKREVVRQVKVGKSPHGVWTLEHAPR
jgi:DNA-binding beta-propeller fold protein YncE